MECQDVVNKIKETIEGTAEAVLESRQQKDIEQKRDYKEKGEETMKSYVDRVKKGIL